GTDTVPRRARRRMARVRGDTAPARPPPGAPTRPAR
ncbi:MAG: hypothetical protein AVDCRST_MAG38-1693, partial [uncultured Solirubrobacteraceae bacterium]